MPDYRKPIPKSQKEISNNLQVPTDATVGNPNEPNEFSQFPDINQSGIPFNRSEQMSRKGDTYKDFTVGLRDIDEAIFYYFENVIRPFVIQNGERRAVPIIYGAPERWKSFQKDGYYRDLKGAIMAPIIMFKRDSITKNRNIANKLDANMPNLYTSWQKSWNSKNFYSNFNLLNNRVQSKQFVANVVPDYVNLSYSVVIQTYYVEQLNKIIEACEYASDAYWGNPQRYQFMAQIDSFNSVNELPQDEMRVVSSTFNINMYGYIIPDTVQKQLSSVKKYNSKSKITISMETTSSPEIFQPNAQIAPDGRTRVNPNERRRINSDEETNHNQR